MRLHQTHTYVELQLTQRAFNEIKRKLKIAKYDHCFMDKDTIDMHGIAVVPPKKSDRNGIIRRIHPIQLTND